MAADKFDNPKKFGHMECFDIIRNVVSPESERLYRQMPLLAKLRNYGGGNAADMVRYIILMYDKQSPFRPEFPNVADRKIAVAVFCGFPPNDEDYVHEMLTEVKGETVINALLDFLKFQGSIKWRLIVQAEHVFDSNERQIFRGIGADTKDTERMTASLNAGKLISDNERLEKVIKALYVDFTGNDPDAEIAIMQHKPLRPETVADWKMPGEDYWAKWMGGDEEE